MIVTHQSLPRPVDILSVRQMKRLPARDAFRAAWQRLRLSERVAPDHVDIQHSVPAIAAAQTAFYGRRARQARSLVHADAVERSLMLEHYRALYDRDLRAAAAAVLSAAKCRAGEAARLEGVALATATGEGSWRRLGGPRAALFAERASREANLLEALVERRSDRIGWLGYFDRAALRAAIAAIEAWNR